MVQTSPAATMGGPPPTDELHRRRSSAGDVVACTAIVPAHAGQVDGRAHHGDPAVDVVAAGAAERRLLATDAAEARSVE